MIGRLIGFSSRSRGLQLEVGLPDQKNEKQSQYTVAGGLIAIRLTRHLLDESSEKGADQAGLGAEASLVIA